VRHTFCEYLARPALVLATALLAGCSPDVDDNCFLDEEFPILSDQYLVATEMYPLFFEHTMDTRVRRIRGRGP
jgi:hypothetical protein